MEWVVVEREVAAEEEVVGAVSELKEVRVAWKLLWTLFLLLEAEAEV